MTTEKETYRFHWRRLRVAAALLVNWAIYRSQIVLLDRSHRVANSDKSPVQSMASDASPGKLRRGLQVRYRGTDGPRRVWLWLSTPI